MDSLPLLNARQTNLIVALGCAGLMLAALYMEHFMGLEPCNLCMMQRVIVIATGMIALAAALHGPRARGPRVYGGLMALTVVTGAGSSMRQLWLQGLPKEEVPACGASLDYMLEVFPIIEVIVMVLQGDGNCAKVLWTFLGVSIPGWTLVAFVGIGAIAAWQVIAPARESRLPF